MVAPNARELAFEVLSEMVDDGGDLGYMDEALPALTAFISEVATPDFVCKLVGAPPVAELTYPGVDGLAEAWREWGEAFEKVRAKLEQVLESEDHIVLLVSQVATTRHQGVEITQPSAMVFAFEDDRVARLEFHLDRDHALRTAGLDPQSSQA
ncbi:MAG: nuclear transport factor 2 family protein [Solirubrobacterales bacterium]